jgi:DNA repair ATPase RecN
MNKLFATLTGNITTITINLEQITAEIDSSSTTFSATMNIKKNLDKEKQNLNKILNTIKNNKFNEDEYSKLQQAVNTQLDKLRIIQTKLKDLQKKMNPYNYGKERNRFCKLLKKFNNKLNKLESSNTEAFAETFTNPNQNQELLLQLKVFKNHIKKPIDSELTIEPELPSISPKPASKPSI